MNTFMNSLYNVSGANMGRTQNGAVAYKSTNSAVYDMFAQGGAYRQHSGNDCILLFKNAFEENESLAMKCLFYLRDVRGGQGERRFFRVCYRWLASKGFPAAERNLEHISEYGRWDDLIFCTIDTPLEKKAFDIITKQLALDVQCKTPSLLAKWLPSENASSAQTAYWGNKLRKHLNLTHKEYRKMLSALRERINVLERLMSANRWDEIEFDKIPSKAGLVYKNAFARRDIIAKKYEAFAKSEQTKVNATTLYPYELVERAKHAYVDVDIAMLNKYWENLPNYFGDKPASMMCVVDTSGSMTWGSNPTPLSVSVSLGMYCAERLNGPFKDHFITFSHTPKLVKINGVDFVDKTKRIMKNQINQNTDLEAVFTMLKQAIIQHDVKSEDIPKTLVIITDGQIDCMTTQHWNQNSVMTGMERIRQEWAREGLTMPRLIYWNVNAHEVNIIDKGPNVSFVSGLSPTLFKSILSGKNGYDLMLEAIDCARYAAIE